MANHTWFLVAIYFILGATTVLAAIPGPNDPRYPDYIVNPPVTCNKEGSFPHPRNCSWYYRCVDRMKVGYFWTYHFECEPGTVFLDELDQCVHPFDAPYACKNGPTPVPSPPTPIIWPPSIPTPDPQITTTKSLPCKGVPGTCKTYDVCKPKKMKMNLCKEIHCPLRTPNLSCGDEYAFDMDLQECVPIPQEADLCPKLPVFNCEGVPGTCQFFDICSPQKEKRLMCGEIRCPLRDPNLSCGTGYLFDMKDQKCTKRPSDSQICGTNISVSEVQLLPCAFNGQIPKTDFVVRKFCKDIALCKNGYYTESKELCDGFYECLQNSDGTWTVQESACPAGLLYSFSSNACEKTPDEMRCRFI